MTDPQNVRIYARFSDKPNPDECESVDRQLSDMREFCTARGWRVVGEYEDRARSGADQYRIRMEPRKEEDGLWMVVSTRIKVRPGLEMALNDLRRGETLMVRDYSRFSREPQLAATYLKVVESKGARLVTLEGNGEECETAEQEFLRDIQWAAAKYQRRIIRDRTARRMREHQKNGRRVGRIDRRPYGTRPGDPEIRMAGGREVLVPRLEPDPEELANIDYIMQLHAQGLSYRAIAKQLEDEGKLCRGSKWYHSTVQKIIKRHSARRGTHSP